MNRFGNPSSKLLVVRRHRTRRISLLHEIGEAGRGRGEEGEGGVPPVDGLELDGVGAGGDLEGELLAFGAVEEVYVLLVLLRLLLRGADDLHRWVSAAAGTGEPKRTARGGADSALTEQLMPALLRREVGSAAAANISP